MEILNFVFLLIALGVFAAVVLSTFVAVSMVWLAGSVASFRKREKKTLKRSAEVRRLAGQEGV